MPPKRKAAPSISPDGEADTGKGQTAGNDSKKSTSRTSKRICKATDSSSKASTAVPVVPTARASRSATAAKAGKSAGSSKPKAVAKKKAVAAASTSHDYSTSEDSDDEDDEDSDDDMVGNAAPSFGAFTALTLSKKIKMPKQATFSAWTAGKKVSVVPGQSASALMSAFGGMPPGALPMGMGGHGSWDPRHSTDWDNSQPLPMCKKRLAHDLAHALSEEELLGIYIQPNEDDITKLHALIIGPKDTPYEGGFFQFYLRVGPDYPLKPPRVAILTTSSGKVRFGPNLYAEGKVCLSILGTWSGPSWTAAMTISVVLTSIQSLMSVGALRNEPGHDKQPLTDPGIIAYDVNVRHETMRVAVLDNLEQALAQSGPARPGETAWPEKFKQAMYKAFHKHYTDWLSFCEIGIQDQADSRNKPKNAHMQHYAMYGTHGVHDWNDLKTRLIAMKKRVPRVPQVVEVVDCC